MKKQLLSILFSLVLLLVCGVYPAFAQKIAVVKSTGIQPYNDVFRGFRDNCRAEYVELVLDGPGLYNIMKRLDQEKPDLVLTIGLQAFNAVRDYPHAPIVYTMLSNVQSLDITRRNITGVSMNVSARKQLGALLSEAPGVKRIGIVYDPSKTGQLFKEASEAAHALGVSIVARQVSRHSQAPDAVKSLAEEVDAFWMLPDTTVYTAETIEYLLLSSFQHQAPVLTFSGKYLEMGAFISLGIDTYDIGAQACELASQVLDGKDAGNIAPETPRKTVTEVNEKVRRKLSPALEGQAARERTSLVP